MTEIASTDLIISLPSVPSVKTFTDEAEFDKLYDAILQKVNEHKHDVSTNKGRDAIKSLAHKIAKTKVALDKQGFALTEEWRINKGKVDATRKKIETRLVQLQKDFRQPLTDWEEADAARIAKHQSALDTLLAFIQTPVGNSSETLRLALATVEGTIVDATWEEFEDRAGIAKQDAVSVLSRLITVAEKQEADAAELAALRAAQAERERQDAERRAAEETAAAEALRIENERKAEEKRKSDIAQAAADAAANAEREAAERVANAEREAAEAVARAEREIAEAKAETERQAEAERQRLADIATAEAAEQARRERSRNHRKAVHTAIVAELVVCSNITVEQAQLIIIHMATGKVPNVTLQY